MRFAMIQMSNAGSVEANLEKSLHAIEKAAENEADHVCRCRLIRSWPRKSKKTLYAASETGILSVV